MNQDRRDDKIRLKPTLQHQTGAGLGGKEKETVEDAVGKEIEPEEVGKEIAPPKELKRYIEVKKETIEIPPDIKKLGVKQVGPTTAVPTAPTIVLPLSDDQIVSGLHAQITSAFRWLAEFCLRQLKKAHIHLKRMGGKIVRVKD